LCLGAGNTGNVRGAPGCLNPELQATSAGQLPAAPAVR
jgi:hypothetical protein